MTPPLLEIKDLSVTYSPPGGLFTRAQPFMALQGISLSLQAGRTLGVVGESGSGKSTLAKTLVRLISPSSGNIIFQGQDILQLSGSALKSYRRQVQMVFQDPESSLNPKHSIAQIIKEPLEIHRLPRHTQKLEELLDLVNLPHDFLRRYPHQLSGGQRQRVGIARALALQPRVLICDEPVSALDLSVQGQVINLLLELQKKFSLALIFISHDLRLVRHVSDDIAVLHQGQCVEYGPAEEVYLRPRHPYTQDLLSHLLPL